MNETHINRLEPCPPSRLLLFGALAGWAVLLLGAALGSALPNPYGMGAVILSLFVSSIPETMVLIGSILDLREGGPARHAATRTCLVLSAACLLAWAEVIYHYVSRFLATLP